MKGPSMGRKRKVVATEPINTTIPLDEGIQGTFEQLLDAVQIDTGFGGEPVECKVVMAEPQEITPPFIATSSSRVSSQIDTPSAEGNEPSPRLPTPLSTEWNKFIMGQFIPEELIEGHPTCDGLRRLFENFIGTIVGSEVEVLQVPDVHNQNRATVKVTVRYWPLDNSVGEPKVISDAADVFYGNTANPYCNFPVGTASTVAEGRCLRKGLRLRVHTADEMKSAAPETQAIAQEVGKDSSVATDTQKMQIRAMSKRLGIDPDRVVTFLYDGRTLDTLTIPEAIEVIKKLNNYQRGPENDGERTPDELYPPKGNKTGV